MGLFKDSKKRSLLKKGVKFLNHENYIEFKYYLDKALELDSIPYSLL